MEKTLTIIVPIYNTQNYVIRCLDSLNHPNINVLIVDDGSTDKSGDLIDLYCKNHTNFKAIHTQNQGAQQARITALKLVNTPYFSFVDSDDYINTKNYFNLCIDMQNCNYKVGNGRTAVYLPNSNIPFKGRMWSKENLDFLYDKQEFSNTTCALWDKIWHYDCALLFDEKSNQKVYEDLEFVYYVLAKERYMIHTNKVIYNYCMRSKEQNSTSAIGLDITKSNGLNGLINATTSMKNKFARDNIFDEYEEELNAIIIKLIYQNIYNILISKEIINKKEMAQLVLQILDKYIPNWQENKYFKAKFIGSEINDYIFFMMTSILLKIKHINSIDTDKDFDILVKEYDKKLILK